MSSAEPPPSMAELKKRLMPIIPLAKIFFEALDSIKGLDKKYDKVLSETCRASCKSKGGDSDILDLGIIIPFETVVGIEEQIEENHPGLLDKLVDYFDNEPE